MGKMKAQYVDRKIVIWFFDKKKFAPKFDDKNLAEFCEGMVGYYLIKNEDGCYEFDLDNMKKDCVSKFCKEKYIVCSTLLQKRLFKICNRR